MSGGSAAIEEYRRFERTRKDSVSRRVSGLAKERGPSPLLFSVVLNPFILHGLEILVCNPFISLEEAVIVCFCGSYYAIRTSVTFY